MRVDSCFWYWKYSHLENILDQWPPSKSIHCQVFYGLLFEKSIAVGRCEKPCTVQNVFNCYIVFQTRFVDNFTRMLHVPYKFDHGEERNVIAFCKSSENQRIALEAGAQAAGGIDLIKNVQNGQISLQNYNYYVAHTDILAELVALRGLMKRKFPNPRTGTLDVDMKTTVERVLHGISYTAIKDEFEKDFGIINIVIGKVS